MNAVRAYVSGIAQVARAPFTVLAVVALTMITVLPFAVVMGGRLQTALNDQPPVMLGSEEIDADWWLEFRRHARGLDATFTPAIIGFAAPLSNLSALLDGEPRGWIMIAPIAIAIVTWAFIWGWAIERFRSGGSSSPRALFRAGLRNWPRFIVISAAAAAVQLVLYLTVHRVLFGPVFSAITASMPGERQAFAVRVALYALFAVLLAVVSLSADYARIASALGRSSGVAFMRRWWRPSLALLLISTVLLGILMLVYGVGETYAGSRVGGWRGVLIGQAFVMFRLAMRLVTIAAEVRLFERLAATRD